MLSPAPGYIRSLKALDRILSKAEDHCRVHRKDATHLLSARIHPTMKPLTHQILLCCTHAVRAAGFLSETAVPTFDDIEESFAGQRLRIAVALHFLASIPETAFEDAKDRMIEDADRLNAPVMPGDIYLMQYAIPNFYFSMATVYAILRLHGVAIGKVDFLG